MNTTQPRESLGKEFAVAAGIALLLPLTVYFAVRTMNPNIRKPDQTAEQYYNEITFWFAYPVGVLAFTAGILTRARAVGSGLMFGGLVSIFEGCYFYWDKLDPWHRFACLLFALTLVSALGYWRLSPRPTAADPASAS